jgi:hypothetical protein
MNPVATSDAAFRGGACPTPEYTIAYTGNYTTSADANRVVLSLRLDKGGYAKHGTGIAVRVLVIDKVAGR